MRVVVVGAGIVGASTAFHLTQHGANVDLIDSDAPGRATLAGAGIVCPWLSESRDPRYEVLSFAAVRYYPELIARLAAAGETRSAYDLVGGLVIGDSEAQLNPVAERLEQYRDRGIKEVGEVRFLKAGAPKELFPYLDSALAGIYLSGAARVSGENIRAALLSAALKGGAGWAGDCSGGERVRITPSVGRHLHRWRTKAAGVTRVADHKISTFCVAS